MLLKTNYSFSQTSLINCKGILVVLELLGNPNNLLQEFRNLNPALFPSPQEIQEKGLDNYQLVPVSESLVLKRRGNFPWERIIEDISKAKKRKIDKDNKIKEEEIKMKKSLDYQKKKVKKQLEVRKLEQGVGRENIGSLLYKEGVVMKYITTTHEEILLREFTAEEVDFKESIKLFLSKYSRVFKYLFSKYSGTGFEKKNHAKSDFDLHAERK